MTYLTQFSSNLMEFTLVNENGETRKATFHDNYEVKGEVSLSN